MSAFIFDSHAFVKKLRASGFTEEQAETIVETARDAASQLATKDDLQMLEHRLTIRLGSIVVVAVGLVAAAVKFI